MRTFKLILSIVFLIWSIGYYYFSYLSDKLKATDPTITEVTIVFADKKQNLYTGIQLIKGGYSPYLFVTGNKPLSQYKAFLEANNVSKEHFIFDTDFAHDYKDYALESALFIRRNKFNSARIVADSSQILRAMIEIKAHVPLGTVLVAHPVNLRGASPARQFVEYNKLVFIFLSNILGFANQVSLGYGG